MVDGLIYHGGLSSSNDRLLKDFIAAKQYYLGVSPSMYAVKFGPKEYVKSNDGEEPETVMLAMENQALEVLLDHQSIPKKREEWLYRGIMQEIIQRRKGPNDKGIIEKHGVKIQARMNF